MTRTGSDVTATHGVLDAVDGVKEAFSKFASSRTDGAPFAVVGSVSVPSVGIVAGVLAFAENEMYAHLLCRSLSALGMNRFGSVRVRRTEWHERGATFHVGAWRARVARAPAAVRVSADRVVVTPETAPEAYSELLSA